MIPVPYIFKKMYGIYYALLPIKRIGNRKKFVGKV